MTFNPSIERQRSVRHRSGSNRRGAAAIEAALILPILILISLAAIDIAQYINLSQQITNASREGARVASRNRTLTTAEVEDSIKSHLAKSYPQLTAAELDQACEIEITQGDNEAAVSSGDLTTVASGETLAIHVSFQFLAVRWLSGPEYWDGNVNRSATHCRRE